MLFHQRSSRRRFLKQTALAGTAMAWPATSPAPGIPMDDILPGERPAQCPELSILNPFDRVPVSFIIDDSTCLVNMGHYCMPQFAEAWPERDIYKKPWHTWPREIPDAFVRKFGEWCRDHGVKGKYSIVPYPACVGWVDRFLPGWSKRQLKDSLTLVRDLMMPDWDIHPEMISHTRVLDLETGRPLEKVSRHTMENSHPDQPISTDYLTAYIAYALQILKNVDLPCEGFTTPGGFGNLVKSELSQAGAEALRHVFHVEVPHYFKYLETSKESSTAPRIEHAYGLDTDHPSCTVNVIGGTDDWFGGWDGVSYGDVNTSVDRFIAEDLQSGRMVEMIEKSEPAIMICHWPGIYCNGQEVGFEIFKRTVTRLHERYSDEIIWMKLSEIARYWAAKELTATRVGSDHSIELMAPFAAPGFTARFTSRSGQPPAIFAGTEGHAIPLREISLAKNLKTGTWMKVGDRENIVCFDLPKGASRIRI